MTDHKSKDVPLPKLASLGIAGVSGMGGWLFTHPFEMWKNTVMTAPRGAALRDSLRRVRDRGLYAGLSSGLARQVVYAPVRLGVYPMARDALQAARGDGAAPGAAVRAAAGALSGAFASALSSPVEVCLVLQTTGAEKMSTWGAARRIFAASGIAGFWRGIGPLASRAAVVGVSQVAVHDQVLTTLREYNRARAQRTGGAAFHDNLVVNASSVLTAFFYSAVTMPLEVARVRMSSEAAKGASGSASKYSNVVQTISHIVREDGVLAMYDCFLPYFCRCAMHTVTCFFFIEYLTGTAKTWRRRPIVEEQKGLGTLS